VVQPGSPHEVAQVLSVLKEQECKFAVKSGGHGMAPGSSNIQDGVLIDLAKLNEITLSEDESFVVIGPGAKWIDVYRKLEERGLLVVGGRVSSVGVGGLILGGKET
jgi:FAD/FMN-containing dehydrogenase